nr:retrotransposon protein, putative, Ty1-copia subclass [Tanacetum cinerariifolium]
MQSGKIKVINGSRVILSGIRRDNYVYSLDGHAMASELNANVAEKDSLAQVWHKRLGHISEAGLQVLEKQGQFGKKSLGGIIGRKFKEWKQLVENQTGRTVKKLRTDNGLEFCNRDFEQLCIESGIARHLTVAGMPQQNGLAEQATCTAAYLINRSSSTTIEKKTPIEMWAGHPSDYGMLRIFGCVAYPHDKQGKLEPRTIKCVFLGYLEGVKGYRLYRLDGESPKIVTSRNVVFNESVMYKDTLKNSGAEDTHEPLTYQEAVACEDSSKWKAVMEEEMDSLRKNKTCELVDPLAGQKLVSSKWLFKIKEGIEVQHISIRVILALTACKDYELEQIDVKTTFLHGNLEEVVYMKQPLGYEQGNKVCLLMKLIYGLKQSPRQWYRRFDEYMLSNGFKRSSFDSCVYYQNYATGEYIYLLLYVEDMLIACKSKTEIGSTKSLLKREFDMKELGEAKKILGMEIVRDRSRKIMMVSQSRYVSKILNNFRIDNGKSVHMPLGGHFKLLLKDCPVRDCGVEKMSKVPYANAVGSLMYLMVCTRPNIAYAVSVVSRHLANPGKNHWKVVKWILKYLRGTANMGLVYGTDRGNHVDVTCFVDSDYAKDPDKGRPITCYAFYYLAKGLLEELGVELNTVVVNCDNQGALHLSRNHVFHERTKHINVRYHFIREVLEAKTVKVLKVGTEHNAADALTKVVPGRKLQHCLELLKGRVQVRRLNMVRRKEEILTLHLSPPFEDLMV